VEERGEIAERFGTLSVFHTDARSCMRVCTMHWSASDVGF
jgi:hypothetical protein